MKTGTLKNLSFHRSCSLCRESFSLFLGSGLLCLVSYCWTCCDSPMRLMRAFAACLPWICCLGGIVFASSYLFSFPLSVYQTQCSKMHFKMNRTNGETSKWINSQKNLSLRACFEEANTFFGTFPGDHKTFGTWKESFLRKEKKNFCFYLQTTFAARVQGGLVLVLSIQHFRLLVVLVTKSTVSICSLKVTWWFYGYLNDG